MENNTAAWLQEKQGRLVVAPYTPPRENEIVVRNHAVAANPIDWIKQRTGDFMFSFVKYPFVLGSDVAGEVVEVGRHVSRFKPRARVLGHAVGLTKERNRAAEGAFQQYTVLLEPTRPTGLAASRCGQGTQWRDASSLGRRHQRGQ